MPADPAPTPLNRVPRHIAIIMDGNGRWATSRGLSRTEGHRRGADAVQQTVRAAADMGVSYLTLFAFSSENWNRPAAEVTTLMELMRYYLKKETSELHKSGARLRVIGERHKLPRDILGLIENAEHVTRDNDKITVVIALSYGGRQDIAQAARTLAQQAAAGEIAPDDIDEKLFSTTLQTADMPDPDLLIRTSGENRVSNFLLWQMAYSELYFTDVYWPDFTAQHLAAAIEAYAGRARRFGSVVSADAMKQG